MKRLFVTLVLAGLVFTAAGFPTRAQAPKPDANLAVILIRDALAALNQTNWTGNYTVLRDYASPSFATANDPVRLTAIFQPIRAQKLNLAPALVLVPKITRAEMVDEGKRLRLTGYFPSQPKQINFDLVFEPILTRWRLFGISVSASEVQPAASAGVKQSGIAVPKPKPATN